MKLGTRYRVVHKSLVRRCELRAVHANDMLQWRDLDNGDVFLTQRGAIVTNRKRKKREPVIEWVDKVTGKEIAEKDRWKIARLARCNGVSVKEALAVTQHGGREA